MAFDFSKNTFVILTGASRGLGEQILYTICSNINHKNFRIIITARNEENLSKSCKKAFDLIKIHVGDMPSIIRTFGFDFADEYDIISKNAVKISQIYLESEIKFEQLLIINNAATLGPVSKRADEFITPEDFFQLENYFRINVTSQILFNSLILKNLKSFIEFSKIYVVNISSLLALNPIAGFSLYASAKAARDSYFKVLACENEINNENLLPKYRNLNVLNYAPGPLDTDMMNEFSQHFNPNIKDHYKDKLVPLQKTCLKLFNILQEGKYKSGDHIDFYDI